MNREILEILKEINPYVEINEKSRLLEEGILDSIGLMILINELEDKYGIKIKIEELKTEWFEDVINIAKMINEKQNKGD